MQFVSPSPSPGLTPRCLSKPAFPRWGQACNIAILQAANATDELSPTTMRDLFRKTGSRLEQIFARDEEEATTGAVEQSMTNEEIQQQEQFCRERGYECAATDLDSKLGFAIETQGQLPINGLRHPPEAGTNGWYIWFGEELSSKPDFFSPLHTAHLLEKCPEALKFLGLPPGYRFLVAGDQVDVWYDPSLLNV